MEGGKTGSGIDRPMLDKIFTNLKAYQSDYVDMKEFKSRFTKMGIRHNDPRVFEMFERLEHMP